MHLLADLGDKGWEKLLVRRGAKRLVGREPPLRWNQRGVRRLRKFRVQCHLVLIGRYCVSMQNSHFAKRMTFNLASGVQNGQPLRGESPVASQLLAFVV